MSPHNLSSQQINVVAKGVGGKPANRKGEKSDVQTIERKDGRHREHNLFMDFATKIYLNEKHEVSSMEGGR